jgi:hypothetical protein
MVGGSQLRSRHPGFIPGSTGRQAMASVMMPDGKAKEVAEAMSHDLIGIVQSRGGPRNKSGVTGWVGRPC